MLCNMMFQNSSSFLKNKSAFRTPWIINIQLFAAFRTYLFWHNINIVVQILRVIRGETDLASAEENSQNYAAVLAEETGSLLGI